MNPNKKHTFSKVLNLKLCQQLKHWRQSINK
jgi:hypothetical protein